MTHDPGPEIPKGVMASFRVSMDLPYRAPGSKQSPCQMCSHPVWLSPKSRALIESKNLTTWCMHCVIEFCRGHGMSGVPSLADLAEMSKRAREEALRAVFGRVNS